jgi:adenylosuccinate synthase
MTMNKVDMVIDLQYGSTGKGLICGWLAETNKYDTVINANMPNAGHTYINAAGRKWMHKVLPNGIVSPGIKRVMIGPGSVFSLDRLELEMAESKDLINLAMLRIHENAVILHDHHRVQEMENVTSIGSTQQGSAAAVVEKMLRDPSEVVIARDALKGTKWEQCLTSPQDWQFQLRDSRKILAEGAQGFSLGINGQFYPYCTSRDCTPARFLADMAIPLPMLNKVIGTARTYPIRVGGTSGGCYPDQKEITWNDIGVAPEYTTVTNRERRVFTFSMHQLMDALEECCPDEVFLNFCNYLEADEVTNLVSQIDAANMAVGFKPVVMYMGYGPQFDDVVEVDHGSV